MSRIVSIWTREKKKPGTQKAVLEIIRQSSTAGMYPLKYVDRQQACEKIAELATDLGVNPFRVDARDVYLALNSLHGREKISARRYRFPGATDPEFCVYLK